MASRDPKESRGKGVRSVSPSAFKRLLALHEIEVRAAVAMGAGDGYSDYFVEGSDPPWHEAFGDAGEASLPAEIQVSAQRMAFVDRVRGLGSDGYSDYFVEGSDPPWHEAFGDAGQASLPAEAQSTPLNRTRALSQLNVLKAYQRMKEQSLFER